MRNLILFGITLVSYCCFFLPRTDPLLNSREPYYFASVAVHVLHAAYERQP